MNIRIPDGQSNPRKVKHNDTVSFKFDEDQNNFNVSGGEAFTPPLPSGGFVAGNKIGPYQAGSVNSTVTFSYEEKHEDELFVTTHTILIGD
jgi:hypothetical protein